jgi:hypothetical protein
MENSFGNSQEGNKKDGKLLNNVKRILRTGFIAGAGAFSQTPATAQEIESSTPFVDRDAQYSVVYEPQNSNGSDSNYEPTVDHSQYNEKQVDTRYHEGDFSQEDVTLPPQILKLEKERRQAVEMMLTLLEEKLRNLGSPNSLNAFGKTYPIRKGSVPDILVAQAQHIHTAISDLLSTVRGVNYRNEEALLLIEAVVDGYEKFVSAYAAFLENNKKSAEMLNRILPVTGALLKEQDNHKSAVY